MNDQVCKNRRRFLKAGMVLTLTGLSTRPAFALVKPIDTGIRELDFYNMHTGESLKTTFWEKGEYLQESLSDINHILRDYRNNEILPIDTRLLDLLHMLRGKLDTTQPIQIISGYRSPATNALLAAHSEGVAKGSLHMQGKAVDVHIEGVPLNELHRAAIALQGGGVGYYPSSNFVHVDVGRVRTW